MRKGLVKNILIGSIPIIIMVGVLLFIFLKEPKRPPIGKDLPVQVFYEAEDGGTIEGKNSQIIEKGKDGTEVKAVPKIGYYFTGWSDGITTPIRKEMNVQEGQTVIAKFAIISDGVTATYKANELGWVNSKESVEYEVQRGTEGWIVTARPKHDDIIFVKWSDGVTTPERQDKDIMESFEVTAIFGYSISYQAGEHGTIVGETEQVVTTHYGSTTEVTAVPDKGYTFISWSDGVTKAIRQDRLIECKKLTAYFAWIEDYDFTYHDNYATANCTEASVKLKRGENSGITISVPIRDHFYFRGWYFDNEYQEQATDEYGKIIVEEVYDQPSRDLYAKWEPVEEDIVTYKILMVYVTAIDVVLKGRDGTYEQLHYRMSAEERAFCEELSKQYTEAVNDLLDGLVRFEVDSYYTFCPITEECFRYMDEDGGTDILADKIPELVNTGMLNEYRSVITVYSLGQIKNLNPHYAGAAAVKYARVPYDEILSMNDGVHTCIHEFIHTIEQGMTCFKFHDVQNSYTSSENFSKMIQYKLYALNQWTVALKEAKLDELREAWLTGEKLGIPYSAWAGDFCKVIIKPECINGSDKDPYGGYIDYSNSEIGYTGWSDNDGIFQGQIVPKGSRTTILSVSSKQGFKFIGWSDGSMDTVRILTDVQEDMTLIAYFERLSYTVEYRAMEGGRIEGSLIQTALKGERYQGVEAIPDEGYRFVGWSDEIGYGGISLIARCDVAGARYYDVETGEWTIKEYFIIYAIFEKIEEDSEK